MRHGNLQQIDTATEIAEAIRAKVRAVTLALTSSIAVAAIALTLGGAGWVTTWSGLEVSVQLASPRWVVGRTISIYYALINGGIAAGSWIWGTVTQNHSLNLALEGGPLVLLIGAATGALLPLRSAALSVF